MGGRTEMSRRELGRVEVLARVKSRQLRVVDATVLLGVCYREAKRLWKRYGEGGAASLKHRSAGRRRTERTRRSSGARC
jgi:helix-turn-helix protein